MSLKDAISTFVLGICFPSVDVYTDFLLIFHLLSPFYCVPYSADEYIEKYPFEKYPERYYENQVPLSGMLTYFLQSYS